MFCSIYKASGEQDEKIYNSFSGVDFYHPKHCRTNHIFGDYKNQISGYAGYAFGGMDDEKYNALGMLQYSQPTEIFRLTGRQNLHLGYVNGDTDWFLASVGIGAFIRTSTTDKLNSRFTFGERAFVGYNITQTSRAEFFVQHFSNGDLTDKNMGYNFFGISFSKVFYSRLFSSRFFYKKNIKPTQSRFEFLVAGEGIHFAYTRNATAQICDTATGIFPYAYLLV